MKTSGTADVSAECCSVSGKARVEFAMRQGCRGGVRRASTLCACRQWSGGQADRRWQSEAAHMKASTPGEYVLVSMTGKED
jgi:hypothetical protein